MSKEASHLGHNNPITATLTGMLDLVSKKGLLPPLDPALRMDGKLCLVTGANSGLGRAVAADLARRGAELILACRSGIPETARALVAETGNEKIRTLHVDLSDLESVHALCDVLAEEGRPLDLAVLNAGLMPRRARRTPQGYEVMFAVHFLANRLLVQRWVDDGLLRGAKDGAGVPRLVLVSSEAHKSADPIDFERFGAFVDYGLREGLARYGDSKLHMSTLAAELARRLDGERGPRVAVHSLCPGPIDSAISRETPALFKPALGLVMRTFFNSPEVAARPVIRLACDPALDGQTGLYMHMMREKQPSALSLDPEAGHRLWEASAPLIEREPSA